MSTASENPHQTRSVTAARSLAAPEVPPIVIPEEHADSDADNVESHEGSVHSLPPAPQNIAPEVLNLIQALHQEIEDLRRQQSVPRYPSQTPAPSMTPGPWSDASAKVGKPSEFTGKASEFEDFMAKIALIFSFNGHIYNTDERKVLFLISYLRGPPFSWAREIPLQEQHPLRHDYRAFVEAFSKIYLDRNAKLLNEIKITTLRQTKSASAYSAEFQTISAGLGINDAGLRIMFYQGLKPEIKDTMATIGRADTFFGLINQAVEIDQRKYQRSLEERKSSGSSSTSHGTKSMASSRLNPTTGNPNLNLPAIQIILPLRPRHLVPCRDANLQMQKGSTAEITISALIAVSLDTLQIRVPPVRRIVKLTPPLVLVRRARQLLLRLLPRLIQCPRLQFIRQTGRLKVPRD